jgi:N-acetylglucosamine kinase-like BadF-type ATPase
MGSMSAPSAGPDVAIAVDGGGSKTDVLAVRADGAVLAHSRGPGSNPQLVGLEAAAEVVFGLIEDVRTAAGPHRLIRVGTYLAGMDLPAESTAFRARAEQEPSVADLAPGALVVENDLFALLRAGATRPDAVAVVCGTGINAVGRRADGATARFPALGTISGDWGGGGTLGMQALWHAARSADGRGPKSVLESLVPAAFDLSDVMEVIEGLHFGRIPERSIAHLTPVLFTAARRGDEPALAEIARQADEIVNMAETALRRLDLLHAAPAVVLGGGVLAANDPLLLDPVRSRLSALAPRATIDLVTAPPVLGAVLLLLEAMDSTSTALVRAREDVTALFAPGRGAAGYEGASALAAR